MGVLGTDRSLPANEPTWTTRLLGALAGLVAALTGLAVAEIAASTRSSLQSPVLDVGDRVIDGVPNSVKELAIDWFGTNDKIALLVGIGSILAVYAAVVGALAVGRRWQLGIVGIALFGLVGAYASQSTTRGAPWYAVIPSLIGAAVAAGVLLWLRSRLFTAAKTTETDTTTDADEPAPEDSQLDDHEQVDANTDDDDDNDGNVITTTRPASIDRRRFLIATGATAVGATAVGLVGRELSTRNGVAAQRGDLELPRADSPLDQVPSGVSTDVDGISPFFTPNADFYRIDTALTVPQISVQDWSLDIAGMVGEELTLSFDDLLDREIVEADITLSCVSNEIGGSLLGTARWLGVRLDDLLADAGIDPDADQIVGRSVDGYTCGFPVAALDGRDALVAIGMNDEPLPLEHGYPARLIVPGLYGYVSATKWLTEIELTRFDQFDQYWVERDWVDDAPIKTQSRIDTPRGLASLDAGTVAVAGVAWAQTRGIDRVELQIDDGDWIEAELADELNDVTWRQWSYAWQAESGRHTIRVRATDRTGAIQTDERTEPFPSGATGQHQIVVLVN